MITTRCFPETLCVLVSKRSSLISRLKYRCHLRSSVDLHFKGRKRKNLTSIVIPSFTPYNMSPSAPGLERSTLHLPRILCLHGGGTNARIFRMQCRVLERSLSSTFRLVYAQGPFSAQPGSDVTSVYQKYGPFKAWQRMTPDDLTHQCNNTQDTINQIDSALFAAMKADDRHGATGEWVALLGFSQGAKIAASILHSQQLRRRQQQQQLSRRKPLCSYPDFRFALLLAGRGPLVWLTPEIEKPATDESESDSDEEMVLQTPTIHVHGLQDPGLELHRGLLKRYFDPEQAKVLEWEGEHRVPIKTQHVNPVVEQIMLVARETCGAIY